MSKDEFNNRDEFRDNLLDGANYRHPVHTLDDMALLAKQSLARQGVAGYEKFHAEEKPAQPVIRDAWMSQVRSHGGTDYSIFDRVNERLAQEQKQASAPTPQTPEV